MTDQTLTGPFPFSAIVGQDEMKLAMILTAIDPGIGGVLVFGDRGTGKSTAVRGLAALLPPIRAVAGCPVNSASEKDVPDWAQVHDHSVVEKPTPVIDLPLGATEDRVVGALDIEKALSHGEKAFEPGLLARANRGYLYIDEVNLLEDHLVDLLLDVAQSGQNVVEREGLSIRHPARFVLVGSGNPEEGELRPAASGPVRPVGRGRKPQGYRRAHRRDPPPRRLRPGSGGVPGEWHDDDMALRARIVEARGALARVDADDAILRDCANAVRGARFGRSARGTDAPARRPRTGRVRGCARRHPRPPARRGAVRTAPPPAPRSAGRGRVHHPRHPARWRRCWRERRPRRTR
jgi:magnesium chelatase subunit I